MPTNKVPINSQLYWERRFETDWVEAGGPGQTDAFGRIALKLLPAALLAALKERGLSLCDFGCASGEAVALWAQHLGAQHVTGVDFSETAIRKACQAHPGLQFRQATVESMPEVDVVFSSNTLEHFADPLTRLEQLAGRAREAVILLLPWEETAPIAAEHEVRLSAEVMPMSIGRDLHLSFVATVDDQPVWRGRQALLVYASPRLLAPERVTLAQLSGGVLRPEHIGPSPRVRDDVRAADALARASTAMHDANAVAAAAREGERSARENAARHEAEVTRANGEIADLRSRLDAATAARETLAMRVVELSRYAQNREQHIDWMKQTRSWRVTVPLRVATAAGREAKARLRGLGERLRGVSSTERPVTSDSAAPLDRLVADHPGRPLLAMFPILDWNTPLHQRPHQLARELAALGYLTLYVTTNQQQDAYRGFHPLVPGCYATDQLEQVLRSQHRKVLYVGSTAQLCGPEHVRPLLERGDGIVYDFFDELHPDISPVSASMLARHELLMRDERVVCIASADRLMEAARGVRSKHLWLAPNAVDLGHFRGREAAPVPAELVPVLALKKPIVGYYGALATWFDYDCVRTLAEQRPSLQIVLIGFDYDGSLGTSGLHGLPNVSLFRSVDYLVLPYYARHFDVATIPFKVNEVTHATSPIKLFEYMALGKPIVSTPLHECRKYKSVLVAESVDDFVRQVDRALELRQDAQYRATLASEANENTWAARARVVDRGMREAFAWLQPS